MVRQREARSLLLNAHLRTTQFSLADVKPSRDHLGTELLINFEGYHISKAYHEYHGTAAIVQYWSGCVEQVKPASSQHLDETYCAGLTTASSPQ
jgi:hypothetical protein